MNCTQDARRKGTLLLAMCFVVGQAWGAWQQLQSLPEPNGFFACGVAGRKIVVVGGTNWKEGKKHWLDVVWSFDPASGTWQSHRPFPHPIAYAVAAEWKNQLLQSGWDTRHRNRPLAML